MSLNTEHNQRSLPRAQWCSFEQLTNLLMMQWCIFHQLGMMQWCSLHQLVNDAMMQFSPTWLLQMQFGSKLQHFFATLSGQSDPVISNFSPTPTHIYKIFFTRDRRSFLPSKMISLILRLITRAEGASYSRKTVSIYFWCPLPTLVKRYLIWIHPTSINTNESQITRRR